MIGRDSFFRQLGRAVMVAVVTISFAWGISLAVGDKVEESILNETHTNRVLVCEVIRVVDIPISPDARRLCQGT